MLNLFAEIFDFFLPRICPACNTKLSVDEKVVCYSCLSKIKIATEETLKFEYDRKFKGQNIISGFTSLYIFEKDKELQQIIHSLKYNQKFLAGKFLGEKLGETNSYKISSWDIDCIVPIPLHHLKKTERGYNQSFYIAKGLSKSLNIQISKYFLKRKKFTQSQTTMDLIEREENMKEAFVAKKTSKLKGLNILLVDDVITTGSTIKECGKTLLNANADKVYAASIAITDFTD